MIRASSYKPNLCKYIQQRDKSPSAAMGKERDFSYENCIIIESDGSLLNGIKDAQKHDEVKEIQWREQPSQRKKEEEPKSNEEIKKKPEPVQFETLEQYELEAAKPRPPRSRDVIEAFSTPKPSDNGFFHLQPSQIQPYGSQTNMYAPSLIRPTNLLKYPRKFKKRDVQDHERIISTEIDTSGYRSYSTSPEGFRQLSTSPSYVAKEGSGSKDAVVSESSISKLQRNLHNLKFFVGAKSTGETGFNVLKRVPQSYKEPWAEPKQRLAFTPPMFQPRRNSEDIEMPIKFSTPEMRQKRKERENKNIDRYYKPSYSDLVKLRLQQVEEEKLSGSNPVSVDLKDFSANCKACLGCFVKHTPKTNQILQVAKTPPEQRSLTTRSKSNLLSKESSITKLDSASKYILLARKPVDDLQDQRTYSKSKSKGKKQKPKRAKKYFERIDYDAGNDICTPYIEALHKSDKRQIPLEPKSCKQGKSSKRVFLPSRVKLAVPPCTQRPDYKECVKVEKCPPRADECLEITPKKLPKFPAGNCPCVDPFVPNKAPKLKELNLKFEDPPKVVCHEPPCQTPRADDSNPYKFKPLKPYVPGECDCIQPPPMKDVKLRRLPRCEPEEVCRPVRVCPVIEKCPPRADECLKVEPKQLPPIDVSPCPCIDPPVPRMAPPIRRLDLSVPEPPRICPKPPPCKERDRADNHLKLKKKILPKFVPGDCPCEDRPMIDWNPKRLVCEDEHADCIVPEPCKVFPRADWGCWEYPDEICEEFDVKCIDKTEKCPPPPPPKGHPCDKHDVCKENSAGLRELRHVPKRRYSNSSASLKLYQQVKSQNSAEDDGCIKTSANTYRPPTIKKPAAATQTSAKIENFPKITTRKLKSNSTLSLVKMLNTFESSKQDSEDHLLFKPRQDEKVNYDQILRKIATSTVVVPPPAKKEPKVGTLVPALKRPKSGTLKVTSRAISTTKNISKDEKDMQNEKGCKGKKTCKNIRPTVKALMCQNRKCPNMIICNSPPREHRPSCGKERVPVCCEKEEPPYSAFTDNLEESITPYTKTPQWTCNKVQYGYHPNFKKEHEPIDKSKKKDKKSFSTSTSGPWIYTNSSHIIDLQAARQPTTTTLNLARTMSNKSATTIPKEPTKALLKTSASTIVTITQNQQLSSLIFHIRPPTPGKPKANKKCMDKPMNIPHAKKISCTPPKEQFRRTGCKRERVDEDCKRKPPPFPAFSDCLDEEMEDILTECPLDREKYLRMQPRFMSPPKKMFSLKPPPPVQGKIDLLKEQKCLREKLCIKNEGLTQCCTDFGKPVPLMKTKKLIKQKNRDCQRVEELKRMGRWPPTTLRQNRRICTSSSTVAAESCRNLSTLGLNYISKISKENRSAPRVKRLYIRNYHALVKSSDKGLLVDNETKLRELMKKMFPDTDDSTKLLKLSKNQWRIYNLKNYDLVSYQNNVAKRARRFYTTYKTKRKSFLRRLPKGSALKTYLVRRRVSNNARNLKYRTINLRGIRYLKTGNSSNAKRYEGETNRRGQSKFTLNDGSSRGHKRSAHRKSSGKYGQKPYSPFPAFSESKKFSRSDDLKKPEPQYSIFTENRAHIREYPEQEKIDRQLGFEYYKCKHGIPNKGTTLDCESLGFCTRRKDSNECCNSKTKCSSRSVVELLVQEHKEQQKTATECCKISKVKGTTTCSCREAPKCDDDDECAEDRKTLEKICMEHCLKCIPCHLPEEEKYCVCREECRKIFQKAREENLEAENEDCQKKTEDVCVKSNMPCNQDCKSELGQLAHCLKTEKDKTCKTCKSDCSAKPSMSKAVICPPAPCGPKRSRSITRLESIWQSIVSYFKARPNCPEPGEWKQKALKAKAEKAAKAAGLIVLNPKCLPPDIFRTAKVSPKDCKVRPKDPCEKRDCDCDNKSTSSRLSKRNFSTIVLPFRNYSRRMSSQNLQEINRLLEESEIRERTLRYRNSNPNVRREYAVFSERKDAETSKALKMSLDMALYKYVDLGELCCKDGPYSRTYFGYSDIIPSRENILERAWRISIESYKNNYPRNYTFFNEFLNKIEKSIHTVEDLEKLKTENVLKELDEFLKNQDSDKKKK